MIRNLFSFTHYLINRFCMVSALASVAIIGMVFVDILLGALLVDNIPNIITFNSVDVFKFIFVWFAFCYIQALIMKILVMVYELGYILEENECEHRIPYIAK